MVAGLCPLGFEMFVKGSVASRLEGWVLSPLFGGILVGTGGRYLAEGSGVGTAPCLPPAGLGGGDPMLPPSPGRAVPAAGPAKGIPCCVWDPLGAGRRVGWGGCHPAGGSWDPRSLPSRKHLVWPGESHKGLALFPPSFFFKEKTKKKIKTAESRR